MLLLNDQDLTYAKTRLDERSLAIVVEHIGDFDNSLARAVAWAAAWDMVRDAEMPARDYVSLVCNGLPAETDINLVTSTLAQARTALTSYADPAWAPTGWSSCTKPRGRHGGGGSPAAASSSPGRAPSSARARAQGDLATLAGWLVGDGVPAGLTIDTELRWSILQTLVANGAAGETDIATELDNDRTAGGERQAAIATALIATPEGKAETWRRLTEGEALPNWLQRALLGGFQHSAQVALTAPYAARYFEVVDQIWATRDSDPAQEFVEGAYPILQINAETLRATEAWLAVPGKPAALRRLVAEGRDSVVRALAGRAVDAAA